MNMARVFAVLGHVWAFCAVGWGLIGHVLQQPLYWILAGVCALVATRMWIRIREFEEHEVLRLADTAQ
jgi:protein-S-isoprenylcysteine O-methyltransferase Ste14